MKRALQHIDTGGVVVYEVDEDQPFPVPDGWRCVPAEVGEAALGDQIAGVEADAAASLRRIEEHAREQQQRRADLALSEAHRLGMDLQTASVLFGVPELAAIAEGRL